jgi:hypothetical protein
MGQEPTHARRQMTSTVAMGSSISPSAREVSPFCPTWSIGRGLSKDTALISRAVRQCPHHGYRPCLEEQSPAFPCGQRFLRVRRSRLSRARSGSFRLKARPLGGVIQFHHVPHVLLRCFPNYADIAARMILSSIRLTNTDFIAKADFNFG